LGDKHAPYAAFDSAGFLYTSAGGSSSWPEVLAPRRINKWWLDWAKLDNEATILVEYAGEITLVCWKNACRSNM
jgi:hypothetical protein